MWAVFKAVTGAHNSKTVCRGRFREDLSQTMPRKSRIFFCLHAPFYFYIEFRSRQLQHSGEGIFRVRRTLSLPLMLPKS
jgi:hypothetical protein